MELLVYADDIVIATNNSQACQKFKDISTIALV